MSKLGNRYIEQYRREYDDTDRYFDLIYDLYEQLQQILNNNDFQDFYNFCLSHINRDLADNYLIDQHLCELSQDLGCQVITLTEPDSECEHENVPEPDNVDE